MCTLILGRDVIEPGSVLLAANRDEDPARPSAPPELLRAQPLVAGGRDRVAGGTWLAVRAEGAMVALLNRRDASGQPSPPVPGRRSRGLLALDVATTPAGNSADRLSMAALAEAQTSTRAHAYAPFSLLFASPTTTWLMTHEGTRTPRVQTLTPGWHVLTHAELDDEREPRTVSLRRRLADYRPRSLAEAEARLLSLLADHGGSGLPPVCLHEGRMVTVSTSLVWLAEGGRRRYLHVEGRPCEHAPVDVSPLLAGAPSEAR